MDEKLKDFLKYKLSLVYSFLELISSIDEDSKVETICISTLGASYQMILKEALVALCYDENENSASD